MTKSIKDPVLRALDMEIFKVLEAAWDDPSPRNVQKLKKLIDTYTGDMLNSQELVVWIRHHRREITWVQIALDGELSP